MKRSATFIVIVTLLFSLSACGGKDKSSSHTTKQIYIEAESSSQATDSFSPEEVNSNVGKCLDFIKLKDDILLANLPGNEQSLRAIKYIASCIDIKNYSIIDFADRYKSFYLGNANFTPCFVRVSLDITRCTDSSVKLGRSIWIIGFDKDWGIMYFMPETDIVNQKGFDISRRETDICTLYESFSEEYHYSVVGGYNPEKLYTLAMQLYFSMSNVESHTNIHPEDINVFITKTFGFDRFDIKQSNYYDSKTGYINDTNEKQFINRFLIMDKSFVNDYEYTVTVNYYADPFNFIKAKTVLYTIEKNKDGSLRFKDITTVMQNKDVRIYA